MIFPDRAFEGDGPRTNAPHVDTLGLRQPNGCTNGGCQLGYRNDGDPPGARNAFSATVVDNFHPTAAGPVTKLSFSAHLRAGGGAFNSPYRDATPAEVAALDASGEPFTITIYNTDVNGVPDFTSIFFQQSFADVQFTLDNTPVGGPITAPGRIKLAAYAGQPQVNWPEFQIYNYCVTLTGAQPFDTSKCYWLGIRHTGQLPDALGTAGWRWMNGSNGSGDNYCYQKFDTDTNFSFWSQINGLDCCFCLDVPFNLTNCPTNPASVSCNLTNLNGAPGNTHCQPPGVRDTGGLIIVRSNKAISTGSTVLSCDNFTTAAATTLSSICLTGTYSGLTNTTRPAPDEAFSIRVFKNNVANQYGYPDLAQQVGPTVVVKPHSIDPSRQSSNTLADTDPTISEAGGPFAVTNCPGAGDRETCGATMTTNKTFLPFGGLYDYEISFAGMPGGGIALPAAGCYWVGVCGLAGSISPDVNTPFSLVLKQWHGVSSGTEGDGFLCAHGFGLGPTFSAADINSGYDAGMCMSFAVQQNVLCPGVGPAANKDCASAALLAPLPLTPHLVGSTLNTQNNGATGNPPAFDSITATDFAPGLFYKINNGASDQLITISTCNSNETPPGGEPTSTQFDSLLTVYCGNCGSLKAVADNDDAALSDCTLNTTSPNTNIGASIVRFPAKANTSYIVYLTGANGNGQSQGFFWLSVNTSAIATNPAVLCSDIIDPPCVMTIPANGGANVVEFTLCGNVVSDDNDTPCPTNGPNHMFQVAAGQTAWGTVDTSIGLNRDADWWEITPIAGNPPTVEGGAQNVYRVIFSSEAPLGMALFTSASPYCPLDPALQGTGVLVEPCNKDYFDFVAQDSGKNFLRVLPTTLSGLDCGTRNKYKFQVVTVTPGVEFGACCRGLNPECVLTTRNACTDVQSLDGSITGVFVGSATCSPQPCDAHVLGQLTKGASYVPFGSCCQPDGTCTITTQAGCPSGNGEVWTLKYSRPASCATLGRCCNGATCTSTTFAACTGIWKGPSATCVASSCNVLTPYDCGSVTPDNCCPYGTLDFRSVCDPDPCASQNVRRCCFIDGSCRSMGPTLCANTIVGGSPGVSSPGVCLPLTCQPVFNGACCKADHSACSLATQAACTATVGNVYKGDNSSCSPDPCTGTCCAGSICKIELYATCIARQATAKFTLTNTPGPCPGTATSPCCKANYNHSVGAGNGITVQDIFDFLTGYFQGKVIADIANNGAGVPGVQSIFTFLAAWFAGGCT